MVTNRFARSYSFDKRGLSVTAVFAAGFIGGGLVALTVQSRPAPANPSVPPISAPAQHAAPISTLPADVLRVIDGDTFEARVHVWPGLDITTKIRLRGVDAPELKARCPAERSMAEAARVLEPALPSNECRVHNLLARIYSDRGETGPADAEVRAIQRCKAMPERL